MNVDRCRYMLEDAHRWLSANRWEKGKLVGLSSVLTILVIWLAFNVVVAMWPEPAGPSLDTPGWKVVDELNAALLAEEAFADTSFVVESESPLRLKLVGAVKIAEDLDELEDFLAKLRPEKDYELAVEVLEEIVNVQPTADGTVPPQDPAEDPGGGA